MPRELGNVKGQSLDLFAGPGGWDVAAREHGLDPLGIEYDDAACATREAAGLRTLQADVAALDPRDFAPCELLIASPPCQAWSMAGKRAGERDKQHVVACAHELAAGSDTRAEHAAKCEDGRSLLVVEPLRFALALGPRRIALEQVPPVLGLWSLFATLLQAHGYRTWAGVLSAERYGVPQTRKRAILMASLDGPVHPPAPTHQAYVPGEPAGEQHTLEGTLEPWVSMAQALGWGGATVNTRGARSTEGGNEFDAGQPSWTLTGKARSWTLRNGNQENASEREADEPAGTLFFGRRLNEVSWFRNDAQEHTGVRREDEPAPTIKSGHSTAQMGWTEDPKRDIRDGGVRVTLQEALILQGFPPDYPVAGSRTKQFEQTGNAVPPPLAHAVLASLNTAVQSPEKAA